MTELNYGHVCFPPSANEDWTCECGAQYFGIHHLDVNVSRETAVLVALALSNFLLGEKSRLSDYQNRTLWELENAFNRIAYPKDNA